MLHKLSSLEPYHTKSNFLKMGRSFWECSPGNKSLRSLVDLLKLASNPWNVSAEKARFLPPQLIHWSLEAKGSIAPSHRLISLKQFCLARPPWKNSPESSGVFTSGFHQFHYEMQHTGLFSVHLQFGLLNVCSVSDAHMEYKCTHSVIHWWGVCLGVWEMCYVSNWIWQIYRVLNQFGRENWMLWLKTTLAAHSNQVGIRWTGYMQIRVASIECCVDTTNRPRNERPARWPGRLRPWPSFLRNSI